MQIYRLAKLQVYTLHAEKWDSIKFIPLSAPTLSQQCIISLSLKRCDLAMRARVDERKKCIAVMVTCASPLMTQGTGTEFGFEVHFRDFAQIAAVMADDSDERCSPFHETGSL